MKKPNRKIITRKEALKIASDIFIKAELSREKFVKEEASRGIQYNTKDEK